MLLLVLLLQSSFIFDDHHCLVLDWMEVSLYSFLTPIAIKAEGRDDLGVRQIAQANLELTVKKDKNSVRIISATLSPAKITCQRSITVHATMLNIGSNDLSNAVYSVKNDDLGIQIQQITTMKEDINDKSNQFSRTDVIKLPNNLPRGIYPFTFSASYDTNQVSDTKIVNFQVDDCGIPQSTINTHTTGPGRLEVRYPVRPIGFFLNGLDYLLLAILLFLVTVFAILFLYQHTPQEQRD